MKTSRPETSRACRASFTAAELIASSSFSRKWPRELAPVRAEGVRLDQLRARVDEAHVQGDDGVGRPDVGLLRAAQPRDGARDECAHAAVRHDGRPAAQALEEAICHDPHAREV